VIQQLRHEPLLAAALIMLASLGSLNDTTSTIIKGAIEVHLSYRLDV
jgi:hypothetical protein